MLNIMNLIGLLAIVVATVCINLFLTLRTLDVRFAGHPRVVTVNSADLILKAISSVEPDVSEEDLSAYVRSMNNALGDVVRQISLENNVIVVNSASVLSGAPDVTDDVLFLLQEAIQ